MNQIAKLKRMQQNASAPQKNLMALFSAGVVPLRREVEFALLDVLFLSDSYYYLGYLQFRQSRRLLACRGTLEPRIEYFSTAPSCVVHIGIPCKQAS